MKPDAISQQLEAYRALLTANARGLLSPGDASRVAEHIDDALVGIDTIAAGPHATLIDVGAGGGLPGIPLAISLPQSSVILLEAQRKKASFLQRAATELGLAERVQVVHERAELAVPSIGRETLDVAVARALAAPVVVAEWLAPFVRVGGQLVLWTTSAAASPVDLGGAAATLGFAPPRFVATPSALRADGGLLVWTKELPSPSRFPRRPGDARRAPLSLG